MDINAEMAALKAQVASMMAAMQGKEEITITSVWVVHQPNKRATWCSKSDCPKLGRKESYDVILKEKQEDEDGELQDIIMQGVAPEDVDDEQIERKVKRVGSPTVKLHDLGAIAAFTSKQKALAFMDDYFRANQDQSPEDLMLTELKVTA